MLGISFDVMSVVLGGLFGNILNKKLRLDTDELNKVFGVCSIVMGIISVTLIKNMPPVILAVVLGTVCGSILKLKERICQCGGLLYRFVNRLKILGSSNTALHNESILETAIILFCFSGTGIYGCLDAALANNQTILLTKSILDLFTAMIFACTLGGVVAIIAVPQAIIFLLLYGIAAGLAPLVTADMLADFKACGGILLIATGCRISKIQDFPISDMLPAMILVFPFSAFWSHVILPYI